MANGCARCSICNIDYPHDHEPTCEVCGGQLDRFRNEIPDNDWKDQVRWKRARRIIEEGGLPNIEAEIIVPANFEWLGWQFIKAADIDPVYPWASNFHVVQVNGEYYELISYLWKPDCWWVQKINPEEESESLQEQFNEYLESLGEGGSEGSGRGTNRPKR